MLSFNCLYSEHPRIRPAAFPARSIYLSETHSNTKYSAMQSPKHIIMYFQNKPCIFREFLSPETFHRFRYTKTDRNVNCLSLPVRICSVFSGITALQYPHIPASCVGTLPLPSVIQAPHPVSSSGQIPGPHPRCLYWSALLPGLPGSVPQPPHRSWRPLQMQGDRAETAQQARSAVS